MDKLNFSIKFWYNLFLVIMTTYIIVWYVFSPPNNQCQMTFMMEPPKFIPVPISIDDNINSDAQLKYPKFNIKGESKSYKSRYTLFLYSEFGVPQSSDLARDLKDSMPVLFVPGNAGSYQQVRSLASTSIRRQLQSLEASKFAFYTIDFNGELSAISGKLIENQTLFLEKALKQIINLHSSETKSVILIGHSVGGFISKVLFTLPNFDPRSVPLLISLASPLVKPHIMFDNKMNEIYNRTNYFWSKLKSNPLNTIAISISGGSSDRLVPAHLSMDPHYDLSITTTSIKDVWLSTDHVCITWCRELMQKLATLMSALMNKKKTRLIEDKNEAASIVQRELLLTQENYNDNMDKKKSAVIHKDWKSMRPFVLKNYEEFYSATRTQLSESIILINRTTTSDHDLLIHIDHIESLKGSGIFACKELNLTDRGQIHCGEKVDLMYLANPIPSKKYETKKTSIKLLKSEKNNYNFLMLDFIGQTKSYYSDNKIPDSLTIQKLDFTNDEQIYIPRLYEMIYNKYLLFKSYEHLIKIESKNIAIIFRKFKINNLNHKSQVYSLIYESQNCKGLDGQSRGSIITYYKNNYMYESFHPARNDRTMSVTVKINQNNLIIDEKFLKNINQNNDQHLELYIDGTCSIHKLRIEFSFYDLIVKTIQTSLGLILTLTTYLALIQVCQKVFDLHKLYHPKLSNVLIYLTGKLFNISACVILWLLMDTNEDVLDKLTNHLIIYFLANGMIAFSDHFIRRILDLATILHRTQMLFIKQQQEDEANNATTQVNSDEKNDYDQKKKSIIFEKMKSDGKTYFNKFLRYFILTSGILISTTIISIYTVLILMKYGIKIQELLNKTMEKVSSKKSSSGCCLSNNNSNHSHSHSQPNSSSSNESKIDIGNNLERKQLVLSSIFELVFSLTVLSVITMISNIPSSLVQFNYMSFIANSNYGGIIYQLLLENSAQLPIAIVTLICIDSYIEKLETDYQFYTQDGKAFVKSSMSLKNSYLLQAFILFAPLVFLTDVITLNTHFCQSMLLKVVIWMFMFRSRINKQIITQERHELTKIDHLENRKSNLNGTNKKKQD